MRTLQWISDNGHYILFCDKEPFVLTSPIRSDVGATAQTFKAPGQDGATTYNATLNQRTISFSFTLEAKGNSSLAASTVLDEQCDIINNAFIPKLQGWLIYNNGRGGNVIRARAIATPTAREQGHNFIKFDVEILTDSATWQDAELKSATLGELQKLWKFPFTLPMTFGIYTQYSTINIPSTEPVYPVFEIYSQLSTLKITNETTGEYIEVNHTIAENQYMRIDTAEKTVSLYEDGEYKEDVSNWADGDFIKLIKGDNRLKAENDTPSDIPAAAIFWRNIIMGV